MDVAILFSGGKDSMFAVDYAMSKGYNIKYLLSVKPTRTDCYLFHFATVEHTPLLARSLGLKHHLLSCDVAEPKQEAEIVKRFVETNKVDALILGGIGLQKTQLGSLREALQPLGIKVFAAHEGQDHKEVVKQMIEKGFVFMIAQVASDGLSKWLGKKITSENFNEFVRDSEKYGFHVGGEGGYYDTFTVDSPILKQAIEFSGMEKRMEDKYSGHVVLKDVRLVEKALVE